MTSTWFGTELACLYGDTFVVLLERIWDLRITYPFLDIVTHANAVKSCFKQTKLHPDIMAAFSIIVADFLYLQTALPFGTDFSPQNWEPVHRLVEIIAEKLFHYNTLRGKHRQYLDRLQWEPSLGTSNSAPLCQQRHAPNVQEYWTQTETLFQLPNDSLLITPFTPMSMKLTEHA